jgi:hypothetical protein
MAYTTINKPSLQFNTILYTGTGSSNSLTGVGFQPDWVWIKKRNGAVGHRLYDAVRGVQNTLYSSDSAAEATGQTTTLTAFNSDGFTVISESGVNASGDTYVAWNWLGANTTVSNTAGTITSTVSANTTAGFSIVKWTPPTASTPQTIGHGLGVAPSMMIVRNREYASNWRVYHKSLGNTKALDLNNTNAAGTDSGFWENTTPTSTLFTTGNGNGYTTGGSTDDFIAYCFAEIKGYSKFGSYVGNGSTDGPFIYTGFKPAMVIAKRTDSTGNWRIRDNKRSANNVITDVLYPNTSASTITEDDHDFLSNGFKVRTTGPENNASGGTFIYMAFAESPLVGTNNVPATAR